MHAAADLSKRVERAALLRRVPSWIAGVLPWCALLCAPGIVGWVAWSAWDAARLRKRIKAEWMRWLDDAVPELEDSTALLVQADTPLARLQQQRLLTRLAGVVTSLELKRISRQRVSGGYAAVLISVAAAGLTWGWGGLKPTVPSQVEKATAGAAVSPRSELLVRITPPKYTGVEPIESAPRDLQAPEASVVEWCLKNPAAVDESVELSDGQVLKPGRECARWSATESVFWRWNGARYTLRVTPDQPPQVIVSEPAEMVHELAPDAKSAAMAIEVRDDYQVARATLHLTLARGSGENIRFSDREMPLPASNDPRVRRWSKQWTLADLGMEPGDELYFFVRATDNAQREHTVQSPTYTLRLPAPAAAEEEASSALPTLVKPESLRSQRQIIIDTEQLVADIKARKPNAATVRERSESIAADQATLRRRYGQFLGEESTLFGGEDHDDDHGGGKQDVLHQFGHAHDQAENATLFDEATKKVLRRALAAMWDAEKALRAITPATALPPEYKALDAIKELQQADRIYLHKTAFTPPAIKEEKRLSGDVVGAASYKREQGAAAETIPSQVRELVQALSADGPLPALWTRTAHDWVREHIASEEQRLGAQRAIQDVADGCVPCRATLRAWLRGAVPQAPALLQPKPVAETPFTRAWRSGGKK
ncbi:DUF4175 family protein [Massilia horti]|uniref:DUF4175 domain-containing protein n=1 Tax=Massilia horti TaxID=2562153 RepID=A0A4Y9T464_9BURK|nr:DUF4175 family protein [Massilia horti]TFW35224.1 hypothetical protein E4O92_02400 [Massilia horti]